MLYSRAQLWLLLGASLALLAGLAIRQWRAEFPELAERLERLDQEEAAPPRPLPLTGSPLPARGEPRPATRRPQATVPVPLPSPPAGSPPVDLNLAAVEDLARLPGVGEGLARRIVGERERGGGFASVDDLRRVLGVGPRRLAALRELVRVTTVDRGGPPHPAGGPDPETAPEPAAASTARGAEGPVDGSLPE